MRTRFLLGPSQSVSFAAFECLRRPFAHLGYSRLVTLDEPGLLTPEFARGGVIALAEHVAFLFAHRGARSCFSAWLLRGARRSFAAALPRRRFRCLARFRGVAGLGVSAACGLCSFGSAFR